MGLIEFLEHGGICALTSKRPSSNLLRGSDIFRGRCRPLGSCSPHQWGPANSMVWRPACPRSSGCLDSRCLSRRSFPERTLLAPAWTRAWRRTAAAARWQSWCRAARSCGSARWIRSNIRFRFRCQTATKWNKKREQKSTCFCQNSQSQRCRASLSCVGGRQTPHAGCKLLCWFCRQPKWKVVHILPASETQKALTHQKSYRQQSRENNHLGTITK